MSAVTCGRVSAARSRVSAWFTSAPVCVMRTFEHCATVGVKDSRQRRGVRTRAAASQTTNTAAHPLTSRRKMDEFTAGAARQRYRGRSGRSGRSRRERSRRAETQSSVCKCEPSEERGRRYRVGGRQRRHMRYKAIGSRSNERAGRDQNNEWSPGCRRIPTARARRAGSCARTRGAAGAATASGSSSPSCEQNQNTQGGGIRAGRRDADMGTASTKGFQDQAPHRHTTRSEAIHHMPRSEHTDGDETTVSHMSVSPAAWRSRRWRTKRARFDERARCSEGVHSGVTGKQR